MPRRRRRPEDHEYSSRPGFWSFPLLVESPQTLHRRRGGRPCRSGNCESRPPCRWPGGRIVRVVTCHGRSPMLASCAGVGSPSIAAHRRGRGRSGHWHMVGLRPRPSPSQRSGWPARATATPTGRGHRGRHRPGLASLFATLGRRFGPACWRVARHPAERLGPVAAQLASFQTRSTWSGGVGAAGGGIAPHALLIDGCWSRRGRPERDRAAPGRAVTLAGRAAEAGRPGPARSPGRVSGPACRRCWTWWFGWRAGCWRPGWAAVAPPPGSLVFADATVNVGGAGARQQPHD